jgi:hypothetical protein
VIASLETAKAMRRISIEGALIGTVMGRIAFFVLFCLLRPFVAATSRLNHVPSEIFKGNGLLCMTVLIAGLACSVLGGFVAALLARHDEPLNGGLTSVPTVLIGILYMTRGMGPHPLIIQV